MTCSMRPDILVKVVDDDERLSKGEALFKSQSLPSEVSKEEAAVLTLSSETTLVAPRRR